MTPTQMHKRIAEVVDSLHDIEEAGEVLVCLGKALEIVIIVAAHDKKDALGTVDSVMKDMRRNVSKEYASVCIAWERKFENADEGERLQ